MDMNIKAIYPPTDGVIKNACYSCGKDVDLSNGFVDFDKPPFKGYLCSRCAIIAIGGLKCSKLLQESQELYRQSKES